MKFDPKGVHLGIRPVELNSLLQLSGLMLTSFVTAVLALWAFSRLAKTSAPAQPGFMDVPDHSTTFLFDDEHLVDATDNARRKLASSATKVGQSDWMQLENLLRSEFPQLSARLSDLPECRFIDIPSADKTAHLAAEWRNGRMRLTLSDAGENGDLVKIDQHSFRAMESELETLRTTATATPFLVWRQAADGAITWANNAYLEMSRKSDPDADVAPWPPARIFSTQILTHPEKARVMQRLSIQLPAEAERRWFECIGTAIGKDHLFTAVAADKAVNAEVKLRDFIQTLTKTFANLKIGLAIFDKQRRLVVFNPALTDLTSLPPEFLLRRPTLHAVLDKLREKRMIPEHRDYKSWRQQLFELEEAAENGSYEETWSLHTGQTYRVTGQPHPDGALAFLMEDISAEVSLTRRFRTELDTYQAVIDCLDEAVAVFSPGGSLTLSNVAYSRLWGLEPSSTIGKFDVVEATRSWGIKSAPTPVWGDVRDFIGLLGERVEWHSQVRLLDGRCLFCRFTPLTGGSTLAGFSLAQTVRAPLPASAMEPVPVSMGPASR